MKVEILKLGPIRNARIDLKPLTVFTGASGLGKSYASLACFYVFEVFAGSRFEALVTEKLGPDVRRLWEETANDGVIFQITFRELLAWCEEDVVRYISYMTGNPTLEGEIRYSFGVDEDTVFTIRKNETTQEMDGKPITVRQLTCNNAEITLPTGMQIATVFFSSVLASALRQAVDSQTYSFMTEAIVLPPSRGAIMDCVSRPKFRAGLYHKFYDFKERLLSNYYMSLPSTQDEQIMQRASRAINGELRLEDGEIFYSWTTSKRIPLSATASSIKELAPYLLWLSSIWTFGTGVLFEEPEAHLHPSRQMGVADTFGFLLGMHGQLIITTHSDYLIKRINQLCRLWQLDQRNPTGVEEILQKHDIDQQSLIDPAKMSAYLLVGNEDGTTEVRSIHTRDGISFESFEKVIDSEFELTDDIETKERESSDIIEPF